MDTVKFFRFLNHLGDDELSSNIWEIKDSFLNHLGDDEHLADPVICIAEFLNHLGDDEHNPAIFCFI